MTGRLGTVLMEPQTNAQPVGVSVNVCDFCVGKCCICHVIMWGGRGAVAHDL